MLRDIKKIGLASRRLRLYMGGEMFYGDLVMADIKLDIKHLVDSLSLERISVPVIGCGIGNDTESAVRAINAGAKEYVPLAPDANMIAAVLEAVTEE